MRAQQLRADTTALNPVKNGSYAKTKSASNACLRTCRGTALTQEAVEEKAGAVIVGEAENAIKALALARNLGPGIVVIDSCLPQSIV